LFEEVEICRPGRPLRIWSGLDLAVEDEEVDVVESHPLQTLVERGSHRRFDIARFLSGMVFGADPHPVRQFALKRLANHLLGLTVPVGGSNIYQGDPTVDGCVKGCHRLVTAGRSPNLADDTVL
jgi:hypothetical protein